MPRDVSASPDPPCTTPPTPFRLAVVPGAQPARWVRVWGERLPEVPLVLVHVEAAAAHDALRAGDADAGLVRLPVDRWTLSAIPLYTETTVVVVPADHHVVAADEVTAADLVDEVLLWPADGVLDWTDAPGEASGLPAPPTTAAAVELVAAGAGVLVVPQSLARLHHRRDVTYRPVVDAPTSSVGLAWVGDPAGVLVEELIGIVRGRTANSSRGRAEVTGGTGGRSARTAKQDDRGGTGGATGRGAGRGAGSGAGRSDGRGAGRGAGPGAGRRGGGGGGGPRGAGRGRRGTGGR